MLNVIILLTHGGITTSHIIQLLSFVFCMETILPTYALTSHGVSRAGTYFSWILSRCTVQWQEYQKAREEVIELMNDAEQKLSEFSLLKTSSSQEAGSSPEKASKAELTALLECQDTCLLELEQQQQALGVLQQRALSMLQDGALPGAGEEVPIQVSSFLCPL